ncbi:hypothetical protein G5714_023208 [Onychostoma macrolepis]|uniref:Immunoglobulin V-set domain-containing protein n=1 Tax=Onychostoma macrolepis TaxID=369639 RepID=A0A7J6BMV8_9TELE|nr:hypothetical protein G5714_023208 [Onychostoma macrolepis]
MVPTRIISAHPGSDIILPVHLSPETSAWTSDGLDGGTTLIYHYNKGQEITNNDYEKRVSLSIQELKRGNLALTLRNVQESDSGCNVFHNGCLKSVFLNLQVNVEGDKALETDCVERGNIILIPRETVHHIQIEPK